MKNRTVVITGIIIVLLAAVAVKKYGCRSSVPALEGWYEPADQIIIKSKNGSVTMTRKDDSWKIDDRGYAGDAELIGGLERKARDFKLLDIVSEKGYYDRYDLTDDRAVTVTVSGRGKVLRKLVIGKTGASGNHSYILVDGRNTVYLASGITQREFALTVPDLREKVICNIKSAEVKSFSVIYGGKRYSFKQAADAEGSDSKESKNSGKKPQWIYGDGSIKLDDLQVNSMLSVFSPLKGEEFPENVSKTDLGKSICTVKLDLADRSVSLDIYSGKSNGMNYAMSSVSGYVFTIGSWQTEKLFIKNVNQLAVK